MGADALETIGRHLAQAERQRRVRPVPRVREDTTAAPTPGAGGSGFSRFYSETVTDTAVNIGTAHTVTALPSIVEPDGFVGDPIGFLTVRIFAYDLLTIGVTDVFYFDVSVDGVLFGGNLMPESGSVYKRWTIPWLYGDPTIQVTGFRYGLSGDSVDWDCNVTTALDLWGLAS